jgi:hypothetical protein
MCEGMLDKNQAVGPEKSVCTGGIGGVSRRTGNAKDRFEDVNRPNIDVKGIKGSAENQDVSACLCGTWAREKELRVV